MELNNSLFKNMIKTQRQLKYPETVHTIFKRHSKDPINRIPNNFHMDLESSSLIKNKSGKNLFKTNAKSNYTIQLINFKNKHSKSSDKKKSTKSKTKKKGESRNINQLNRIFNSNNYLTATIGNNTSTKNNFNNYLQSVINNSSTSIFTNNLEKKYLITVNTHNYKNVKKNYNNINNSKKEKNIMNPLSMYTNNKFYENKIILKQKKVISILKEQSPLGCNNNNEYSLKDEIKLISSKLNRKNHNKIKKEIKVDLLNFPKKNSTDKLLQQKTRSVLMKNINDINPCEKNALKNAKFNINLTMNLENDKKLVKKAISRNRVNKNTYFDTKLTFNDEMKKSSFQNYVSKNSNNSVMQTNLNKDSISKALKNIQSNDINKIHNIKFNSKTKRIPNNKFFRNQYYPREKYRNKAKNYNRVVNMPLKLCKKFSINKHHQNEKKINIGVVNIIKEVFKPNLLNFNYINSINNINSSNFVGGGDVNIGIKKTHNFKNLNINNKIHNINNTLDNILGTSNYQNDNSTSIVNNYNYSKGVSKEKIINKNNKISHTCSVNRNKNKQIIHNAHLLNKIKIPKLTNTSIDVNFLSKNKPKKIYNINNINKVSKKTNSSIKRKKLNTKLTTNSNLKNLNDKIKHNNNTSRNHINEKEIKEESKEESKEISKNNIENQKTFFKNIYFIDEYMEEIFFSLLSEEKNFLIKKEINPLYLKEIGCEITPEIRTMVVDWLIELHQIFDFRERTLFITVQILDKYLSKKMISFEDLQLLAITALNIGSKQEEVEYPILDNYITVSGDILTKEELISMENKVLSVINYKIVTPTVLDFFEIMSGICDLNPIEFSQALYLMNIVILDVNMLKYNVSVLAFAILNIVTKKDMKIFIDYIKNLSEKIKDDDNKKIVEEYLEKIQDEEKINKLIKNIRVLFRTLLKTHYQNAQTKFATQKFHAISTYSVI